MPVPECFPTRLTITRAPWMVVDAKRNGVVEPIYESVGMVSTSTEYVSPATNPLLAVVHRVPILSDELALSAIGPLCKDIALAIKNEEDPQQRLHGVPIELIRKYGEYAQQTLKSIWTLHLALSTTPLIKDDPRDPFSRNGFWKVIRDVHIIRVQRSVARAQLYFAAKA